MSDIVWYQLLQKGAPCDPSDQANDVQCSKSMSISNLRRLVKTENPNTLDKVDPGQMVVYKKFVENGSNVPLPPGDLLSAHTSGNDSTSPFIILYPGIRQ